jgi:hypothetical protein
MSYSANLPDLFRRAGDYVNRILRGAKPSDIPVKQPTKRLDLIMAAGCMFVTGICVARHANRTSRASEANRVPYFGLPIARLGSKSATGCRCCFMREGHLPTCPPGSSEPNRQSKSKAPAARAVGAFSARG